MTAAFERIVVAMSGGVDSSVVAGMLRADDVQVIGMTMQLYDAGQGLSSCSTRRKTCCAGIDIYDAKEAAETLGITHYVLNYESRFKQAVMEDFADSYIRGETPIPCVKCNQEVKFLDLVKMARNLGASKLATGHYARKVIVNGEPQLHSGADVKKDQSYFLFATTLDQLEFVDFPLGSFTKERVRQLAQSYGLKIANKPDSQDICFVPDGDYKKVVESLRPGASKPGPILDIDGKEIGQHQGTVGYTIGQRKGLGISALEPYYVLRINPASNSIVVGPEHLLDKTTFRVRDVNWLVQEPPVHQLTARLRSSHIGVSARIADYDSSNGTCNMQLEEPTKLIAPGQACVFYEGSRLLGGGWIMREDDD